VDKLIYGDNLENLRKYVESASTDLVYVDQPFNSNRNYNVIFGKHEVGGNDASAQIQAFDGTWNWTPVTDQQYERYVLSGYGRDRRS
jgi:adenine specific DNA methylase Mod